MRAETPTPAAGRPPAPAVAHRLLGLVLLLAVGGIGPAQAQGFFDSPGGRGLLSVIVPGSGQALQGDVGAAVTHFSLFAGAGLGALHYSGKDDFLEGDERFDDARELQFYNDSTLKFDILATLATDVAFYSGYAAYRDARLSGGNKAYATPAPKESFNDLVAAPFRLEYLKRPTTFLPLLLVAGAVAGVESGDTEDGFYEIRYADDVNETELQLYYSFGLGMGPAVGEEAFFRGFLNNQFSHSYGRWGGLALSSLAFALGHAGQGNQADFASAGVAGAYLGWLQQRNGYEIGEGVAIHFWSNFLVGLAALENGGRAPNLISFGYRF